MAALVWAVQLTKHQDVLSRCRDRDGRLPRRSAGTLHDCLTPLRHIPIWNCTMCHKILQSSRMHQKRRTLWCARRGVALEPKHCFADSSPADSVGACSIFTHGAMTLDDP